MSDKKRMRLEYDVQRIEALKKLNDEFLLVKIYAMATGKNRNFTYISKEDVINAIPSAYYCPVVGHIRVYVDDNGVEHMYMGSHDFDIDDNWEIKDATRPYGVIVENSEGWETIDEHGKEMEYLTFNAILWVGRYPELNDAAYGDDVLFNQSMEINIDNYRQLESDSNYWEVLGFTFSAFCLLGRADEDSTNGHTDKEMEHTEPAFISAKVVPYELNVDEFKKEFSLLKDKISQFCMTNVTVNETERGESMAEENKVVDTAVTDFDETSVVEDTNEATVQEQNENFEDETDASGVVENEPEAEDGGEDGAGEAEGEADPTTENEAEEVTEGETQEQEQPPVEEPDYEAMYNEVKNAYDGIVAEFEAYKSAHSYSNEEYQVLVDYRNTREQSDRNEAEDELFSSFESLIGDTDEYSELKDNASNYSLEDLKLRLYAIVGMQSANKEKQTETVRFSLGGTKETNVKTDPYGNAREYFN